MLFIINKYQRVTSLQENLFWYPQENIRTLDFAKKKNQYTTKLIIVKSDAFEK